MKRFVQMTNGIFPPYEQEIAFKENGERLVPPAFIPRNDTVRCWNCDRHRTLLTNHCEHCDAEHREEQISETDHEIEKSVSDVVENAVKSTLGEVDRMLPSYEPDAGEERGGTRRKRQTGGMKYLTNDNLSKEEKDAKILGVRYDGENRFGPRVILKIDLSGDVLFWGVNIRKNPNYKMLVDRFGRDENDWVGENIKLFLEKDDFSESYFPRVEFGSKKKK